MSCLIINLDHLRQCLIIPPPSVMNGTFVGIKHSRGSIFVKSISNWMASSSLVAPLLLRFRLLGTWRRSVRDLRKRLWFEVPPRGKNPEGTNPFKVGPVGPDRYKWSYGTTMVLQMGKWGPFTLQMALQKIQEGQISLKVGPYQYSIIDSGVKWGYIGMSMVLSKWIITPIKVGCKSRK